jgi:hypothetical protein
MASVPKVLKVHRVLKVRVPRVLKVLQVVVLKVRRG